MKKILSIFLSATLIVTCLLSLPLATQAVVTIDYDENLLFATETITSKPSDTTVWLGVDPVSTATVAGGKQIGSSTVLTNHVKGSVNFLSKPILKYNVENGYKNVTDTSADEFEWEFIMAGAGAPNKKAVYGYFFYVDTDRETYPSDYSKINNWDGNGGVAGLADIHNCFAVIYSYTGSTDGLAAQSFTFLQPEYDSEGNSLGLRPIKYTEADGVITPDASSYYKFIDGGSSTANTNLRNDQSRKITLTLKDNLLTFDFLQTNDVAANVSISSSATKSVVLSNASMSKVSSGDFVMSSQGTGSNVCYIGHMTIKELTVPENYYAANPMFDSSKITDNTAWLYSNVSNKTITFENGEASIPASAITKYILDSNGYSNNKLEDFVWEFEFKTEDALAQPSFYFHLNDSNTNHAWPTANKRGNIKYALGSTVYGESDPTVEKTEEKAVDNNFNLRQDAYTSILRIDVAASNYSPAQYYLTSNTDYYIDNANSTVENRKPVSYLDFKTDVDGTVTDLLKVDTYYTVRFVMTGNTLLTEVWQSDAKDDTYNSIVTVFTNTQMEYAPSGDFGILTADVNSAIKVKNMKIYNGVSHLFSTEDYSKYEAYKTSYTFDEDTEALTFNIADPEDEEVLATQSDGKLALFASEHGSITINNIDSGNRNLGDFIAKWDITDDSHNWANERMNFRKNGSNYYYRLSIAEAGLSNATAKYDTYKYTYLTLEKKNGANSDVEVLAQYPISAGLMNDVEMTIKVEAIGNTIKVWFSNTGYDMAAPVITYTDTNPLTTGYMEYLHSKDSEGKYTYIDNFTIYDLTAKAAAEKIADTDVNAVNCTKKADYIDILALHDAQIAKFDTAIADKAEEIITALDHNHQVDTEASSTATYFVAGKEVKVCEYCNDTVETTLPVAEDALIKDECKEEFANGNLTITLAYSEALIEDIDKGAVISFNYSIGNYSPEKPIEIDGTTGAVITLEGFNTDRLNAELTYYLTAEYTGVNTDKLAGDTTRKLTVANDVELDGKTSAFVNALNADGANTVVSTKIDATTHFAENTITADLKEGTMVLNF
ncbi:MAG: hypothetical protein IJD00_06945, partial [Clostridia bacterium]|nr:hypothetical protein [Clostridia bacterium]